MELICNFLDLDGSWDVTWMEERRKYRDLGGSETGPRWRWDTSGDLDIGGMGPGWKRNAWDPDGGEIQHGWRWDENIGTLILFSRDLYKDEMQHAGKRDANLATWMQVGQDLDGGEIHFLRPGCGRDAKSWDVDACEALTGCCWDANLRTWIVIRTKFHGLSGGAMWPGWENAHRGT